jgi:hypothetical protein
LRQRFPFIAVPLPVTARERHMLALLAVLLVLGLIGLAVL